MMTAGKPLPGAFSLSLEGWGLPGHSELSSHLLPHTQPPAWTGTDTQPLWGRRIRPQGRVPPWADIDAGVLGGRI